MAKLYQYNGSAWVEIAKNGTNGIDGTNGREVEFQKSATHIQWRYVGDVSWTNLVALSELSGPAGSAGADGADGVGVPTGGTANQVLAKIDETNYNTHWVDQSGGGTWGSITGTLSSQTDLQTALDNKVSFDSSTAVNPLLLGSAGAVVDGNLAIDNGNSISLVANTVGDMDGVDISSQENGVFQIADYNTAQKTAKFSVMSLTNDTPRTYTLPDKDGTLATTADITTPTLEQARTAGNTLSGQMDVANDTQIYFQGTGGGNGNAFKTAGDNNFLFDVGGNNSVKIKGGDSVGTEGLSYTNASWSDVWRVNTIGDVSQSGSIAVDGEAARNFTMGRRSTSDSIGTSLTIQAGGATSGATNRGAGELKLMGGISTGNGGGIITFHTASDSLGAGTDDRNPTEKMRLSSSASGRLALGTTTIESGMDGLTMGGEVNRVVNVNRRTGSTNPGVSLTLKAGNAAASSTDKAGGTLYLKSGLSTGTGIGSVIVQTPTPAGSTGTADNSYADRVTITNTGVTITGNLTVSGTTNLPTASSNVTGEVPSGTVNGSNTSFTLASTPVEGSVRLYRDGQRMVATGDYSISGTTITFVTAPATGSVLTADYAVAGGSSGNADTLDNYHASSLIYQTENLLKNGNFINNSTNGYGTTPDDWTASNANPVQGGFPTMTKQALIDLLGVNDGDIEGLWNLNGNLNDLSSNGYNLTASASAPTDSSDGLMAQAKAFAAASSQYASNAAAATDITSNKTVFALIKPTTLTAATTYTVLARDKASDRGWMLYLYGNNIYFYNKGLGTTEQIGADINFEVNKWYFVCGVVDITNSKVKIWVNGIKKEAACSGASESTTANFAVGCNFDGGSDAASGFFTGLIQNCGVLSVALTDSQVKRLFASTLYRGQKIRRATNNATLSQSLPEDLVERLRGKTVTFSAKAYITDTNMHLHATINDGTEAQGQEVTVANSWRTISVTRTISSTATAITVQIQAQEADANAWIKELTLTESSIVLPYQHSRDDWSRFPRLLRMDIPAVVSGYQFEENRWFTYVPTIFWNTNTAVSGSPTKSERFMFSGKNCKITIWNYNYTNNAATILGIVSSPIRMGVSVGYYNMLGEINSGGSVNLCSAYADTGNNRFVINSTSVTANRITLSGDYEID